MELNEEHLADAMRQLSRTYHKILKVNLTDDTYIEIKTYDEEREKRYGYADKISVWLKEFALSGRVYDKDVESYLSFTDTDKIRAHFRSSDDCIRQRYRRRTGNTLRWVMMELLKASDYSEDNETIMLYIQDIHDSYVQELEAHKALEYACNFDPLTGIGNMYAYKMKCQDVSERLFDQEVGVIFSDLNALKVINDTKGHERGDEYIIDYAKRLREYFSDFDCYRISGDEFLVVSVGTSEDDFRHLVESFMETLREDRIPVASVGYCFMLSHEVEPVTSIAEERMYVDKQAFYDKYPELKRSAVEKSYQEEMSNLIRVMSDSYEVLLIADLDNDSYHIMKQNATSINAGEPEEGVYTERNKRFCEEFVSVDFKDLRESIGSIDNLKDQLKSENHIVCDYRLKDGSWRESSFWKMESDIDGEPKKVIYYSQNIDHSMVQRLSRHSEVEKEFDIIAGLRETYSAICTIDLRTERIDLYQNNSVPDYISSFLHGTYSEVRDLFVNELVIEEQRERFYQETELIELRKQLQTKKTVSLFYHLREGFRDYPGGSYAKFVFYFPIGDHNTMICATRDITDALKCY